MDNSETEVIKNLKDYHTGIMDSIRKAVRHYQERLADESGIISQTTVANYIHDFMVEYAKTYFRGNPNVEVREKRKMVTFIFKNKSVIILKFKKFNKHRRVSHPNTIQALSFIRQGELFPDFKETTNLIAGYLWDATMTEVDCLYALPNGKSTLAWIAYIPESTAVTPVIEVVEETTKAKPKLKTIPIKKVNEKAS